MNPDATYHYAFSIPRKDFDLVGYDITKGRCQHGNSAKLDLYIRNMLKSRIAEGTAWWNTNWDNNFPEPPSISYLLGILEQKPFKLFPRPNYLNPTYLQVDILSLPSRGLRNQNPDLKGLLLGKLKEATEIAQQLP